MKKILCILCVILLLCGCSDSINTNQVDNDVIQTETPTEVPGKTEDTNIPERNTTPDGITIINGESVDDKLANIAKELYGNLGIEMNYVFYILEPETFETSTFIPYQEGLSGVSADPMIGSIPHSLILLKVENDSLDGEELAKEIEKNADLNKWICVSAEAKKAIYKDGYIMFVMSDQSTVDNFAETFNNLDLK